jgi:3-dehydroquinate synthetase
MKIKILDKFNYMVLPIVEDMIEVIRRDKKLKGDTITIVVINKIGKCDFVDIKIDRLKKYL